MARFIVITLGIVSAFLAFVAQSDPYQTHVDRPYHPGDQIALDHRDSVYAHTSWIISEWENYAQLRFYDKVEGGACLNPTWDELAGFGLSHLAMPPGFHTQEPPAGPTWPKGLAKPNMGTLSNTRYINLYPSSILLNQSLMKRAQGDPKKAAPRVAIIGLGSGIGMANLAHHFPEASMTVIDIDQVVIDMVRDHYPLLRWLENQQCSDGRQRLRMVCADARRFFQDADMRDPEPYDVIVLDAYTSGSTIPPHLMTKEFYGEMMQAMDANGILMSNIIGSYRGKKHRVLGGAIRSMRAAGLTEIHNIPVAAFDQSGDDFVNARNNILLASQQALNPQNNKAGWRMLQQFTPYEEFPLNRYVSKTVALVNNEDGRSLEVVTPSVGMTMSGTPLPSDIVSQLQIKARQKAKERKIGGQTAFWLVDEPQLAQSVRSAVRTIAKDAQIRLSPNWISTENPNGVYYREIDWVAHSRDCWKWSLSLAATKADATNFLHDGSYLTGDIDPAKGERPRSAHKGLIDDAPLFTDGKPNADIVNH